VRKVTERQGGTRKNERAYLGGLEIYREYEASGNVVSLERETLHVMDGQRRIALVETRTQGSDGSPAQLTRYQFSNHLGSASLEVDEAGQIISYEDYYPYGSTSYQAVRNQTDAPKRYRYTGKERDEETGFAYYGFRYYAFGLSRWISTDPTFLRDGLNLYSFTRANPVNLVDPMGTDSKSTVGEKGKKAFLDIVERCNNFGSIASCQLGASQSEKNLIHGLVNIGMADAGTRACSANDDLEYLFTRGASLVAEALNLGPDYMSAVFRGNHAFEARVRSQKGLYGDVWNGLPMTKDEHDAYVHSRHLARLKAFDVWVNLVASMGLPGPGGGGSQRGSGGGRGYQRGVPVEAPSIRENIKSSTRDLKLPRRDIDPESGPSPSATDTVHADIQQSASFARPGGQGNLAGHGGNPNGNTTIPNGTTLIIPRHRVGIRDETGQILELGAWWIIAKIKQKPVSERSLLEMNILDDVEGMRILQPGDLVQNYTLTPPTFLNVHAGSILVNRPTSLSDLLQPNMGIRAWAACTSACSAH
jgi:RHS repeat-associated protein